MFKRVEEMEKAGMTDSLGPQVSLPLSKLPPSPVKAPALTRACLDQQSRHYH
jgi:hypothetical protein